MRFEYKQIISMVPLSNKDFEKLGNEEWELVCVANYEPAPSQKFLCFYFKRMMVDEVLQKIDSDVEIESLQKSLTTLDGSYATLVHDDNHNN